MTDAELDAIRRDIHVDRANTKGRLTTAPEYLRRAAEIMDERGKQYDSPQGERSMGRCVTAFNALTGRDLTEAEGWLLQQLLKDARQWSGEKRAKKKSRYHRDSAEDGIAYAALKAEALDRDCK